MKIDFEKAANYFLELSSEQRLAILSILSEGKAKVSSVAKLLDASIPEVFRNFERLGFKKMLEEGKIERKMIEKCKNHRYPKREKSMCYVSHNGR